MLQRGGVARYMTGNTFHNICQPVCIWYKFWGENYRLHRILEFGRREACQGPPVLSLALWYVVPAESRDR